MKSGIHPDYRDVVFHDTAANVKWITRSTLNTSRKITMDDGKEYPLVILEISSFAPVLHGQTTAYSRHRRPR